jgi:hypothetical protein
MTAYNIAVVLTAIFGTLTYLGGGWWIARRVERRVRAWRIFGRKVKKRADM